jgi:hypothetical protein
MDCVVEFAATPNGYAQINNVAVTYQREIMAFRWSINSIFIDSPATDGVEMLLDIQNICDNSPLNHTFAFSPNFYRYEAFVIFESETKKNLLFAMIAVFFVILIFTGNLTVTFITVLCVALVNLFLFGIMFFWDV